MEGALKDFFGFALFRPFQKEIIHKILKGQDCLVVMATGSGKSLCYQLPPLISKKPAVVISPLISLMQDQVMGLKERGIKAEFLSSAQTDGSVALKAKEGEYALVFMTPEKALGMPDSFWTKMVGKGMSLLAVDEAHCISEWGHDFRKEYQQLHKLRRVLPNTPFVALTATATERVRDDIKTSLQLKNYFEVVATFDRPNIFYGVKFINRNYAFREELAKEVMKDCQFGGSTLIYCTTIKDVEEVTGALVQVGVNAQSYHSKMSQRDREAVHRAFAHDELQIVVATVAFGMGIDKPDIRRVIHYGCPKSLEAYYQESGRCGRDGLPSSCWLYYTRADFAKADFYMGEASTEARKKVVLEVYQAAEKYCKASTCRRKFILEYFGETMASMKCGNCDNCTKPQVIEERDVSEEAHLLLSSIEICGGRFGMNMPIDVLRGSRAKKILENKFDELPLYGLGSSKSANWWKALGDELLSMGYLVETRQDIYRFVSISGIGKNFLQAVSQLRKPIVLIPNQEMLEEELKKGGLLDSRVAAASESESLASKYSLQSMSEAEVKLCESLLKARADLAKRNFTAPYAIFSETTLQNLAKVRPSSKARLLNVDGVNQWLVNKHGDEILKTLEKLSSEYGLRLDSEKPQVDMQRMSGVTKPYQDLDIKATPAKVEAWRMWQEVGMRIVEIANLPERPKPIKEETVTEYIMDCCRLGYKVDWERFCAETGFSATVAKEVQAGVKRVGGRDKLKPIKEQVPEHISYLHIKIFLMMEDLSLPHPASSIKEETDQELNQSDEKPGMHEAAKEDLGSSMEYKAVPSLKKVKAESCSEELPWLDGESSSYSTNQRRAPLWRSNSNEAIINSKRARVKEEDDQSRACVEPSKKPLLTEESLMDWLSKHDGVSIENILSAFSADKNAVMALTTKLEDDFIIYKRGDLYRII